MSFKTNTYALSAECTSKEQLRLRNLVTATKITYEFYEEKDFITGSTFQGYKVSISNFRPDFYVYNEAESFSFENATNLIATEEKFLGGITYKLPFYASKGSICEGYLIMTKSVKMIPYNKYWNDSLCKGYETYELCKKFSPINISSYDEFQRRIKQYIKSLDRKEEEKPSASIVKNTVWQSIESFFISNYMIVLTFIIVLGTTGIIIVETRKRRSIL